MSIVKTALDAAFGAYYNKQGTNKDLLKKFIAPSEFEAEWAPVVQTDQTVARKSTVEIGDVLQAFQKGLTPDAAVTFTPIEKALSKVKYEVAIDPDDIEQSFVGFMANVDTNDRSKWDITRYVGEELLINKGRENWDLGAVYKGVYVAPTIGTAGTVAGSHNGLGYQIAADITATTITPVNGPASWSTTASTFVTEVMAWIEAVKAVSATNRVLVETKCDKIFMAPELRDRFAQGCAAAYGYNYGLTGNSMIGFPKSVRVPYSNLFIVGVNSMIGRNRVVMTFAENRYSQIKRKNSEQIFGIDISGRSLTLYADFWKQTSYWIPQYVFVNQLT